MGPKLVLQLHTHSEKSHDSIVPVKKYVKYLEEKLSENEYAVLAITDHNVIPFRMEEALKMSTKKVIIIPGIEWRLYQSFIQGVIGLCGKREVITLGNHNDLRLYINKKTNYKITKKNDEILGMPTEREFLDYISKNQEKIIIVPHPKHIGIDFYGKKQIKKLNKKIGNYKIKIPLFVEEKTGYDPFPRISRYKHKYPVVGGSDAHEIKSIFGTESFFAVETSIYCNKRIIDLWNKAIKKKDVGLYKKTMLKIFKHIKENNKDIIIKKNYFRSILQFIGTFPRLIERRIENSKRKIKEIDYKIKSKKGIVIPPN